MEPNQLTAEQQAFIDAVVSTNANLILQSCAGSGKTATLVAAAKALPASSTGLALAFNKANKIDLEKRMPSNITSKTFHSLGYTAWCNQFGVKYLPTDNKKVGNIASKLNLKDQWLDVIRLVSLAKNYGYMPPNCRPHYVKDNIDLWELTDELGIFMDNTMKNAVDKILCISIDMAFDKIIDFDDMLYMPLAYAAPFTIYPIVFVDEVQDLSTLQFKIVKRSARRIIAAGDKYQAIYAFRGARANSMDLFKEEFSCQEYRLTESFRCPKAIVSEAQAIMPLINPRPEAREGKVFRTMVEDLPAAIFNKDDIILARTNRKLIAFGFWLLSHGRKPKMNGVNFTKRVFDFAEKIIGISSTTVRLDCKSMISQQLRDSTKKRDIAYCEMLLGACDDPTALTWKDIKIKLNALFETSEGNISLSTIHKAKGLEWERVFILDRNEMPHFSAKLEHEIAQEMNLIYVAITRSQRDLIYLDTGW